MKLILSPEEARSVVYQDHEDFELVQTTIVDKTRWSVIYHGVYKHLPTNKFYSVDWSVGATEQQDESPFEYDKEVEFIEVEPREVTVIKWIPCE